MTSKNRNEASGAFLGFLFQIERVLLWLSEGGDGQVGIETDDDIVVQVDKGIQIDTIYEQAKNAQTHKVPFSNHSEDLWKTLSIWIKAIEEGRVDPENTIFSAITNKKLPNNRLIKKLSNASKNDTDSIAEIISELKETASKLKGKIKKYGDIVVNCNELMLTNLIDKISVLDGTFHHDQRDFKRQLKSNLSMGEKLPFDHIFNGLLGHITARIIDCWRRREEAWISVKDFNNLYNDLIGQYNKKSFLEKNEELLPVSKGEIDKNRKSLYVEQLRAINCKENEILEAIHDFLRSKSEKSRYAKEFEVTEDAFKEYYDDLKRHWIRTSRPRFKINSAGLTLEDIGYQVYYETIHYKGKLNNQEPQQSYTYIGAYHYLANLPEIGWHPTWDELFKS